MQNRSSTSSHEEKDTSKMVGGTGTLSGTKPPVQLTTDGRYITGTEKPEDRTPHQPPLALGPSTRKISAVKSGFMVLNSRRAKG